MLPMLQFNLRTFTIPRALLTGVFLVCANTHAAEVNYPTRPVRMLVGFTPGGTSDVVARIMSKKLTEAWGQQFVVDNRAGAAGILAAEITARAVPDGHTLFFVSSSFSMQPSATPNLPYDIQRDFTPITLAVSSPYVLVLHPAVEARSVKELIALAKAKPGQLASATAGPGSAIQGTAELFNTMAGVNILLVPYKGAVGITDLIAGQVQTTFAGFVQTMSHVRGGRLRAIAVTSAQRSALVPDLPTVAEAGVPGYEVTVWYGLVAPAKLPRAIVDKLHGGFVKTMQTPDIRQNFTDLGVDAVGNTPEQFAAVIRADADKWMRLSKSKSR